MNEKFDLAIVGATGAVGEAMREVLEARKFPVGKLHLLASERSAGTRLQYCGKSVQVENLADFDFSQVQLGLFSPGGAVSAQYAPQAAKAGCIVIDNTSHFRRDKDIPLVVPEINPQRIADYTSKGIIANPNCSTIQMLLALFPLHRAVGIKRINVATYQAVSGAGASALKELAAQTANLLNAKPLETDVFLQQIAFNVLPQIGDIQENGYSLEEMKMAWETQKILEDASIQVNASCVRVPVFYGHSEAVHIETDQAISAAEARKLIAKMPGVKVIDDQGLTPVTHAAGKDPVFVSRIREDHSLAGTDNEGKGLSLWVVSDNIRKGAALNSVQIAEQLVKLL